MYQPRIRAVRIRDLHAMKEYTNRPMTVLVDEALSIYLSAFLSSPDYLAFQKNIGNVFDQSPMPTGGECKVITVHNDNP